MPPSDVTVSTSNSVSVLCERARAARRRSRLRSTSRRARPRGAARRGCCALRVEQPLRIDRAAPRLVDAHDLGTAPARHLAHALAEHAVHADDRGVAGLEQVDEARLHAGRAGAADRQRQRVRGLEHGSEPIGDLVEHDEEVGIEVPEDGRWSASITSGYGFDGPGPSRRRSVSGTSGTLTLPQPPTPPVRRRAATSRRGALRPRGARRLRR